MKINSNDFRVRPKEKVKLKKWPTLDKTILQVEEGISKTPGNTRRGVEFAAAASLRFRPLCLAA